MSKIIDEPSWLSISDAANHLSKQTDDKYSEMDICRQGLDGKLKISVIFPFGADACEVEFYDYLAVHEKINRLIEPISKYGTYLNDSEDENDSEDDKPLSICTSPCSFPKKGNEYADFGNPIRLSSKKIYDLPLIGAERTELQKKRFSTATAKYLFEGTFVVDENGKYYCMAEWKQTSSAEGRKELYPTAGIIEEFVFIVREEELIDFIDRKKSLSNKIQTKKARSTRSGNASNQKELVANYYKEIIQGTPKIPQIAAAQIILDKQGVSIGERQIVRHIKAYKEGHQN